MPTYNYQCERCEEEFEVRHAVDKQLTVCSKPRPEAWVQPCGGRLKKLLYPVPGKVRGGTPKFHR